MSDNRKQNYFAKLIHLLEKYPKLLLVGVDNVGSNHMQRIRINLRGKAELLMGKNTMIRKAIKGHLSKNPGLEVLLAHLKGNVGFVFTNLDLKDIRTEIENNKVSAPARIGSVSPCDVFLPAGITALDPSQTSFMQALNIATRINKGNIEIINQVHLLKIGEKVGSSEAALLQKLDIRPFQYGLVPVQVFENGTIFSPNLLDITDDEILKKFSFGVQRVAALSLQTHIPTAAAVPHLFANAYRNLVAVSIATDYTFERVAKIKDLLSNPEALAAAAAEAAAAAAAASSSSSSSAAAADKKVEKKEEKKEEKVEEKEEEDDAGFGDLFG